MARITHEDDYIFTEADADENFLLADKRSRSSGTATFRWSFRPTRMGNSVKRPTYEFDEFIAVKCEAERRLFVNPGSVGQPRDGDPRASFVIWDETRGRMEFYRVEYDLKLTQQKMRNATLPDYLIQRLAHGR